MAGSARSSRAETSLARRGGGRENAVARLEATERERLARVAADVCLVAGESLKDAGAPEAKPPAESPPSDGGALLGRTG